MTPFSCSHKNFIENHVTNRWPGQHSQYTDTLWAGMVQGSNPGGGEILYISVQTGTTEAHIACCTMGLASPSQGHNCQGMAMITHPHLTLRLKEFWNCTPTPLCTFMASYMVNFILCYKYSPQRMDAFDPVVLHCSVRTVIFSHVFALTSNAHSSFDTTPLSSTPPYI